MSRQAMAKSRKYNGTANDAPYRRPAQGVPHRSAKVGQDWLQLSCDPDRCVENGGMDGQWHKL